MFAFLCVAGCAKSSPEAGEGEHAASEAAIGVAECDDYIKKMDDFLATLPEEARTAREPGFKAMRASWRDTAATPAGKDSLRETCKGQLAALPASK